MTRKMKRRVIEHPSAVIAVNTNRIHTPAKRVLSAARRADAGVGADPQFNSKNNSSSAIFLVINPWSNE